MCFFSSFSSFNDEKIKFKDYNKRTATRDKGRSGKEESKWNSTINPNSGAHTLTHDQIIKKVHSTRIT